MFPGMQPGLNVGQVPNVPTPEELWKNEPSKYRHWIILFGIGLLTIMGLLISSFIFNLMDRGNIIDTIVDAIVKRDKRVAPVSTDFDEANKFFVTNIIVYSSIQIAVVFIGFILFLTTTQQCYKKKSFSGISKWATFVVGLGAFYSLYQVFQMVWGSRVQFNFGGGIFQFVNYLITIFIYLLISAPLNKVRREFMVSERVQAIKSDPRFKDMQNNMANGAFNPGMFGQGPFGPMPTQPPAQGATPLKPGQSVQPSGNSVEKPASTTQANTVKPLPKTKVEEYNEKLSKMTIRQLKAVAKELSISGYSTMLKNELIESIIRVSNLD